MRNINEEDCAVPTNVVGSGAIAGVGIGPAGEPGKNNKKKLRDILLRRTPTGETTWMRNDTTR